MTAVWIIGNGGHARVMAEAVRLDEKLGLAGFLSDDPSIPPVEPGLPHLGPVTPDVVRQHNIRHAIIAIGARSARERISALLDGIVEWASAIHPHAHVSSSASIGRGVLVGAGSIIQPGARVGDHTIVNTGVTVDHDTTVGAFVHLAQGAVLAGRVTVGDGVVVGVGASIASGVTIGNNVIIHMGSVVTDDIPDGARVGGNPARPVTSSSS